MKKITALLLAVLMLTMAVFTGCGKTESANVTSATCEELAMAAIEGRRHNSRNLTKNS